MPHGYRDYYNQPNLSPQTLYDMHLYEVKEWKRHHTWKKNRFYW